MSFKNKMILFLLSSCCTTFQSLVSQPIHEDDADLQVFSQDLEAIEPLATEAVESDIETYLTNMPSAWKVIALLPNG